MPAATRIGDADVTHCSGMVRAQGSGDVFVNSIPWSRQGDVNTVHLLPGAPCPPHAAPIAIGSTTVFVNSKLSKYFDSSSNFFLVNSKSLFKKSIALIKS